MRTAPTVTAAALLAALTLTACGGGDGDSGGDDAKTGAATAESGKGGACTAAEAGFEVGPSNAAPAAGDEGAVPVTVTNKSGASCTLKGVAHVELVAGGKNWPLAPQDGASKDTVVTLEKGRSMTFTISYVRAVADDPEKGTEVDRLLFGLPGETEAHSYDWPDAEVAIRSGGTLDAAVGPFLPAGD